MHISAPARPSPTARFRWTAYLAAAVTLLATMPGDLIAKDGSPSDPRGGISERIDRLRQWLLPPHPITVHDHSTAISSESSSLSFHPKDGSPLTITLVSGRVVINGQPTGSYLSGGPLDNAWRTLVKDAGRVATTEAVLLARSWAPDGLTGHELEAAERVRDRLQSVDADIVTSYSPQAVAPAGPDGLTIDMSDLSNPAAIEPLLLQAARRAGPNLRVTVPNGQVRLGHFSVGSSETIRGHLLVLKGNADIYGMLAGNVATVDGDVVVHPGGVVDGDVLTLGGDTQDIGGEVRGEVRTLVPAPAPAPAAQPALGPVATAAMRGLGLVGVFLTLLALGFGLVLFGRPQLEVVADTVAHSFARSFVTGLLAQMLLLPTFGMLVVGLILSVVGVLLLPFAVIAFGLLVIVGVVGGYLAVAHAMGETYIRRRLAMGTLIGSANSYRYVMLGLAAMLAIWAVWVVFGWVPVAGPIILGASILVTWLSGTVGLGAALLSHAGLKESFAGRLITPAALTDEFLWATPQFGVPAAKRLASKTPTPLDSP